MTPQLKSRVLHRLPVAFEYCDILLKTTANKQQYLKTGSKQLKHFRVLNKFHPCLENQFRENCLQKQMCSTTHIYYTCKIKSIKRKTLQDL